MTLDELISLITETWPHRFERGRVLSGGQPWLFRGWNHTGAGDDILEYRVIKSKR